MKKICLITGGTSKLGQNIAKFLHNSDYKVFIQYNNSFDLANQLLQKKIASRIFCCDFLNDNAYEKLVLDVGNIDLLINNAAMFVNDSLDSLKSLEQHIKINVIAPLKLIAFLYKHNTTKANIINIGDANIDKNENQFYSYHMSKTFLKNAQAQIYAPKLRVNTIAISPVIKHINEKERHFSQNASNNLFNKPLQLHDIYETIAFLEKTESIIGQTIILDYGGRYKP